MTEDFVKSRVSWFNLDKKFGFVKLDDGSGDAFLHLSVLKAFGYVTVPAGATMDVRVELAGGKRRVTEISALDASTASPNQGEPLRRQRADP